MVEMTLFAKQKWRHRYRAQTWMPGGQKEGRGLNWDIGTDIYVYTKDSLYKTDD